MNKRLVVCCDGTWNVPDQASPTNVVKLALAVSERDKSGIEQRVFYHQGVGTTRGERIRGGSFGLGLSRDVRDCYRFLCENYDPGDELYFIGFSRGAFTARSTAGLVRNSGVLRRENLDKLSDAFALYRKRGENSHPRGTGAKLFRRNFSHEPRVRFIGVFDTVGALGVPLKGLRIAALINRRWQFHDTALSSQVERAHHALAIDEKRGPFQPTLWDRQESDQKQFVEQVWFAGVHSDVGGGYPDCALAEIPLLWMADRAAAAGLAFTKDVFAGTPSSAAERAEGGWVGPDPMATIHESRKGLLYTALRPHYRQPGREQVADPKSPGTVPWFKRLLPGARPSGSKVVASDQSVSSSARDRFESSEAAYDPPHLGEYLSGADPEPAITDVRSTPGAPNGSESPENGLSSQ